MITKAEIHTEALRGAKARIKRQIVADGGKLCYFKARDIDRWAKELIAGDPGYLRRAKGRLAKRASA
jgi:hypothetical protein